MMRSAILVGVLALWPLSGAVAGEPITVPEPGMLSLLGVAGVVGVIAMIRRRRK